MITMKQHKLLGILLFLCLSLAFQACKEDDNDTLLRNDCLKRTLGPNIVGENIYFAYAMALPYHTGKIVSAQCEASIAGAEGTWMENYSYHTNADGVDVPVLVGKPDTTTGKVTSVEFSVDTCAATLRYYYKIPEEARGQSVSFTFSAKASNGETVSMTMGPYQIAKMEIKRGLTLTKAKCYISIEDMAVYDAVTATTLPSKIDLVYLWRNVSGIDFGHAFVSPAANPEYRPDISLPEGANNETKIRKEWGIIDSHLTTEPNNGTYIDDIDFETIDLSSMPDYAINMKKQGGMWIETQNGKYRAFIYINDLKSISGGTISMKRYTMK